MDKLVNEFKINSLIDDWKLSKPFHHIVLDNFLTLETATFVVDEFPKFSDEIWYEYDNAIEVKKTMNNWDRFGPITYKLFWFLNSDKFIRELENLVSCKLYPDFGLNGAGLHSHKSGGKLNVHLDYSIHPKLKLERRLNLLIYLTPNWKAEWGGELGFWEHDLRLNKPAKLSSVITPQFNRAVLFDTTQNSWHGLPDPINCPLDITRNSLAVYYLCDPRPEADDRGRALFVPNQGQTDDREVLELIKNRSDIKSSHKFYRR